MESLKRRLCDQFNDVSTWSYNQSVDSAIEARLEAAFQQSVSTSLFVVGPRDADKDRIVDKAVHSYEKKWPHCVARVSGSLCTDDTQALGDIVNQFVVRNHNDKNSNIILDELQAALRHRRSEGLPAIVIIDDVHEFAKRGKQTLIYTLLDLMHKRELFLVLIGLSHCFHLHTMLEKRVTSRLNAQFLQVPAATAESVCHYLCKLLTLPENFDNSELKKFNDSVLELFGTSSPRIDGGSEEGMRLPCQGTLFEVIECCVNWGRGISYFRRLAELVVSSMSQPVLTLDQWNRAVISQEPLSLLERLCSLSHFHLHLIAACCRIHCRSEEASSVSSVLIEFDKLSGMLRRKDVTRSSVLEALLELSEQNWLLLSCGMMATNSLSISRRIVNVSDISDHTSVHLIAPAQEVQACFRAEPRTDSDIDLLSKKRKSAELTAGNEPRALHLRPLKRLQVPERLRKAVAEPLQQIATASLENVVHTREATVVGRGVK